MDFTYLFLAWSLTNAVVNGSILDPIRDYFLVKVSLVGKLLSCVMCVGFWSGFILALLFNPGMDLVNFLDSKYLSYLAYGFISSGFSVLMNSFIVFMLKPGMKKK